MTAAPRRPLRVVANRERPPADGERWHGETVAVQWEPESQLVGALMWLPAARVRPILELVPDTAILRPMTRWVYEIIRKLVADGRDPDPVAVLARAGHQAAAQALAPDRAPTPEQHHRLAVFLADLYTHTVAPTSAAGYARDVLDRAYRRAFRTNGIRMRQLAESGADRGELTAQFGAIRDELAELWRRAETAAKPGWDTPRSPPDEIPWGELPHAVPVPFRRRGE
jgi:replicative DNA helicase